jgi:hypothetical protein
MTSSEFVRRALSHAAYSGQNNSPRVGQDYHTYMQQCFPIGSFVQGAGLTIKKKLAQLSSSRLIEQCHCL